MTTPERNKASLVELLGEIDRRQLGNLEKFYAPDYLEHNAESVRAQVAGIDGVRRGFAAFTGAFDDFNHSVHDLVAEGDRVAARITFSGIFARPLFGLQPTGARVNATGIAIYRFVDGRIAEKWGYFDALGYLRAHR